MPNESKLFQWEYEPGIADLSQRQQELYQDLAFLIERQGHPSPEPSEPRAENDHPEHVGHDNAEIPIMRIPAKLREERGRLGLLLCDLKSTENHLETADSNLVDLLSTLKTVTEKTDALYGDCEDLVHAQQQLTNTADLLHAKIEPLLEYDRIAVQLNAPGVKVTTEGFPSLLDKLQHSVAYLTANPSFKEFGLFKTRFSQLYSKASALIRNEVDRSFQHAVSEALTFHRKTASVPESALLDAFSVLYAVFQQASSSSRVLLKDLDERGSMYQEQYGDLLQECHRLYFSARATLINPFIQTSVTDFRKHSKQNITELLRTACSFLVRICREEFRLYHQYFSHPSPILPQFLSDVCQIFYDGIRPEIIHLDQVEKISDVCCFLNQEILKEHSGDVTVELVPFVEFVRALLADSRERLMFRVNQFISTEISGYKAGRGDLAYPEKLEVLHQLLQISQDEGRNRMSSRASVSSISSRAFDEKYLFSMESQGFWFPTLRRAVGFLSKLYQSLDAQSFKIIAQEVIFRTIESLIKAADELLKLKGQTHADLFLVSHLLVLREHLTLFQVDLSTEETSLDFSRVVGAAKGIVSRKGSIFSLNSRNALLDFFLSSSPEIRTNTVDSRKAVDVELRNVCLRLVNHLVHKMLGPLPEFLDKADVVMSMEKPNSSVRLRNQAFATPQEVKDIVAVVYKNIKTDLPAALVQFLLYLISVDSQYVLYKPVKTNIWKNLEQMNRLLMEGYSEEDRALIAWPSMEVWNVMLNIPPQLSVISSPKAASNGVSNSDVHHV